MVDVEILSQCNSLSISRWLGYWILLLSALPATGCALRLHYVLHLLFILFSPHHPSRTFRLYLSAMTWSAYPLNTLSTKECIKRSAIHAFIIQHNSNYEQSFPTSPSLSFTFYWLSWLSPHFCIPFRLLMDENFSTYHKMAAYEGLELLNLWESCKLGRRNRCCGCYKPYSRALRICCPKIIKL